MATKNKNENTNDSTISLDIFKIFLWKNYRFLYFNKLHVLIFLIAECIILGLYFGLTLPNKNKEFSKENIYNSKELEELKTAIAFQDDDFIFYTPKHEFLKNLMDEIRNELSLPFDKVEGLESVRDVMGKLQSKRGSNSLAVNFESFDNNLKYSISSARIKLSTNRIYYNDRDVVHVQDDDQYLSSGFFTLQHLIDLKFMKLKGASSKDFSITVASMPTIELEKIDSERVLNFGSFVVVLLNVLLLVTFLVPMVEEKQDGIREYLSIATQYSNYNGIAFFLTRSVIYIIFMVTAIIIGFTYKALGTATVFYVIILFALYLVSTMFYTYLISICFNSVFYTKVGGIVLLLTPYLFFLIDGYFFNVMTYIFSTKTFLEAIRGIQVFTNKRSQFYYSRAPSGETYNSILLLALLVLQGFVYGLLYFYFSKVFPGRHGVRNSFNVFSKRNGSDNLLYQKLRNELALEIKDLTKSYTTGSLRKKRKRTVVDKLDMDIESNKITVLLGHNGAGKTTTINMILGIVTKTSGNIKISSDCNVQSFRPIGYCPQHNVYMQYLTCKEHLEFFARLRGLSASKAKERADELLVKLKLADKEDKYGKQLSGGMKRRLCLGMAIVGETTLVILDEPSSGLDIESRRLLWDILLDLRKNTAILITTHHMEEAEVLGDKIAILMNGTLQHTGTSMELKRSSDCGFILKLLIKTPCNRYLILKEIKKIIPDAYIRSFVDPTLSIHLPYNDHVHYEEMLKMLETNSEEFGILNIGLSDSTLNDVFLKKHSVPIKCTDEVDGGLRRFHSKEHAQLKPDILKAVFYKKYVFIKREWKYFIFMMLIPFIATFLALSIVLSAGSASDLEKLSLNLHHLKRSTIYLKSNLKFTTIHTALENEIRKFGGVPVNIDEPMITFLLNLQNKNLPHFYDNVVGAIEIQEEETPVINIYFSGNIIHSSTVLLNLVDNAMLIAGGRVRATIEAQYLPIQQILDINPHRLEYYAAILPIGMFFYMMYFVSLPFKEEKYKFKYLQGTSKFRYWLTFFTFDIIHHLLICTLIFGLHKIVLPENMYNSDDLLIITSSIFFYGFAYLPILYFMATGFRSMSTLTTYLFFMLIVSSIAPLITSGSIQSMVKFEDYIAFLNLLPDFALNHQMRIINENFFIKRRTKLLGDKPEVDIKPTMNLLNVSTFYCYEVFIFLVAGFMFVFVWESLYRRQRFINIFKIFSMCKKSSKQCCSNSVENEDVQIEKERVKEFHESDLKDYPLVVRGLEKSFDRGVKVVKDLSFSVNEGECFGLLGVNGAGKTTTFQMITGNESISSGKVSIQGVDIIKDANRYKEKFGYCPQSDCLDNFMTSYEVLKYIALLRGISCSEVNKEVETWLDKLDLVKYKDMQIRYYSGGTKRKLNAAIAMIASPSLIMLDEPTTGVDPISRRFLWDSIEQFKNDGKTIVLTSHSMDECEHLCNRLAIMANGEFQCLGHIPKLKADFGQGFTINFRILENISDEGKNRIKNIEKVFENCVLREHHAGLYTYFVESKDIKWSNVFSKLYNFCKENKDYINFFSINETSLEDIFLEFEKKSKKVIDNCEIQSV